jgi:ArsR family transcriptional regulator
MDAVSYSMLFKALADPTRCRVMRMLTAEKRCACQLLSRLEVSQPTLSHHMAVLVAAGLVVAEKKGKWVWYGIDVSGVDSLRAYVDDIGGDAVACATCGEEA